MTVKELIETLEKLDKDKDIKFDCEYCPPFDITEIKESKEFYIIS